MKERLYSRHYGRQPERGEIRQLRAASSPRPTCLAGKVIVASTLFATTKVLLEVYLAQVAVLHNGSLDLGLQVRGGYSKTTQCVGDCQTILPQMGPNPAAGTLLEKSRVSGTNGPTDSEEGTHLA